MRTLFQSPKRIQLLGIAGAEIKRVAVSSKLLQRIAAQLERNGHSEIRLQAEVELFLRVSNSDVLSSIECTDFRVLANANDNAVCAVASSEKDCGQAWERGIEPIKQAALQGMRRDVWNMDAGRRPLGTS